MPKSIEQIRVIPHRTGYEQRLARVGRRGALAVHVADRFAQHDIVRHVAHKGHRMVAIHLPDAQPHQFNNQRAVGVGIVGGGMHGFQILVRQRATQTI